MKRQEEDGLVVEYEYSDSGIRTAKTVNDLETKFYLNGSTILSQVTGEEQMDFLYDDAGALLGFKYNGACYYYIQNLQGDIIGILDSTGAQIVSYTYGAWGEPVSVTGTAANTIGAKNPFRYRGYYYDSESELYYLNSRYYDPEFDRWINADIPELIDGGSDHILENNLFIYCFNNPINMIDDTGNWPKWATNMVKVGIGVLAIGIGVAVTVATGGAAAPVLAASFKMAVASAAIGAAVGAGTNAVNHCVSTGSWSGAGKAALSGAVEGAANGFMWGGISAGVTFTAVVAKGAKIQRIGKLKPTNKVGKGYRGVQYKNQRGSLKSFELHSPHKSGPHQKWHWQQNTWNPKTGGITGRSVRWTLFGRKL